ncbi:UMF1 family MFS transporter [Brevibacterium paucivorans]|uniref:UMF1 family MFS transporter n=1 Tax=Brevibacterium paucivorans TaxID=170994 RepID=A0ABS2SKU4_9MICO|nr:MFS transporter [Brevibacterium paucivorans]MBM7816224.1 UMF1 family MFS transporter [Brevibacterium paucivorans]
MEPSDTSASPHAGNPPAQANPAAAPEQAPAPATRSTIVAWALWDWGSAAFNAVIITFVFTPYLTSKVAGDHDSGTAALGFVTALAGLLVAVIAPAAGVRADAKANHHRAVTSFTMIVVALMGALFFVKDSPAYFVPGLVILCIAQVVFEIAQVSYNGMLPHISTPANAGTVSNVGWAMGYLGGLALLFIALFTLIQPEVGLFGATDEGGLRFRLVAVLAAVWFLIFSLPLVFSKRTSARPALGDSGSGDAGLGVADPEYASPDDTAPARPTSRELRGFAAWKADYARVIRRLAELFKVERSTFVFFVASAIFRDGLATIFAMAGVIAAGAYEFSGSEVIYLGIAANVVAGVGCLIAGKFDDWLGPKAVIVTGLICLIAGCVPILVSENKTVFWVTAMWLCLFVGPVQASSRSFLSRITAPGRAGENFGLYATTGRAVSFLGPALFALCVTIFGFQRAGGLGIMIVLALGLVLMLRVPAARTRTRA